MDEQHFNLMLDEIYSAFGRERPHCKHAAYRSLWRRICDEAKVPNEAAKAIAYEITKERDSLRMNLGRDVLLEYDEWLLEQPDRRMQALACPDCDPDSSGFFWMRDACGNQKLFICACNRDPRFARQVVHTRKQVLGMDYNPRHTVVLHSEPVRKELPPLRKRPWMHRQKNRVLRIRLASMTP